VGGPREELSRLHTEDWCYILNFDHLFRTLMQQGRRVGGCAKSSGVEQAKLGSPTVLRPVFWLRFSVGKHYLLIQKPQMRAIHLTVVFGITRILVLRFFFLN
jgi:hypothetical protein